MNLKNQRRMAAALLKCGETRIWISNDPGYEEHLEGAITRADVRKLISWGVIQRLPERGNSRARYRYRAAQRAKGKRRGAGSRKGGSEARNPRKRAWIRTIRPLRARLAQLRTEGRLDASTYRTFYARAKGGMFKSKAHLDQSLRAAGALKEAK